MSLATGDVAKPSSLEHAPSNTQTSVSSEPRSRVRRSWHGTKIVLKNLVTLLTLQAFLPLTGSLLLLSLCRRAAFAPLARLQAQHRGTFRTVDPPGDSLQVNGSVLVSGGKMTKALLLARAFKRAGFRVVLGETEKYRLAAHRFSNAVDEFIITPEPNDADYETRLDTMTQQLAIDHYVPVCSPIASVYDSKARSLIDSHCNVVHPRPESIDMLDDKFQLAQAARKLGLGACESYLITDPQQVIDFDFSEKRRPFILKSIVYDSVRRLDLTPLPRPTPEETEAFVGQLPISPETPWVLQEFVEGTEYCTHSTVRLGELRLHVCCESSPFQVNYEPVDDREIEAWVQEFVSHYELDGQISFDFIRAHDDGQLFVIECNPRTHSAITTFYNHPDVATAYLSHASRAGTTLRPLDTARPTYWLAHELYRLLKSLPSPRQFTQHLRVILNGKEAVFDWRDPLPFFMLHHVHIPALLLRDLREQKGWVRIDFNIGKLVQAGGD